MNELEKRRMIISYKQLHPSESNYAVAKYFKSLNVPQSTVYNIIKKIWFHKHCWSWRWFWHNLQKTQWNQTKINCYTGSSKWRQIPVRNCFETWYVTINCERHFTKRWCACLRRSNKRLKWCELIDSKG